MEILHYSGKISNVRSFRIIKKVIKLRVMYIFFSFSSLIILKLNKCNLIILIFQNENVVISILESLLLYKN